MNWKELFHNRKVQIGIAGVVVLAIIIALLVSSCTGSFVEWEDPLGNADKIENFVLEENEPEETQTEETEPPTEQTEPPTEGSEPPTEETVPPTEDTEPSTETTEPPTEGTEPEESTPEETGPEGSNPNDDEDDEGSEGGSETIDLALELSWKKKDDTTTSAGCGADGSANAEVSHSQINDRAFIYTLKLVGANANDAKLVSAEYTNESGESGSLNIEGGTLTLEPVTGTDTQNYNVVVKAKVETKDQEGNKTEKDVTFSYKLVYTEKLDVKLSVNVSNTNSSLECNDQGTATFKVKNNQLTVGKIYFDITLTGADAENGRILSVEYVSPSGETGTLTSTTTPSKSYNLPVSMPENESSCTYTVTVTALTGGQYQKFTIKLNYTYDISLKLIYNIGLSRKSVTCENGKTKQADTIHDNELENGKLSYSMELVGGEADTVSITKAEIFQNGNGKTTELSESGDVTLLLKDGLLGENSFRVTAQDSAGNEYRFTINVPYKHKGINSVAITTNLTNGQSVLNEYDTLLMVGAYSSAEAKYLPASSITVKLDGETIAYTSSGANGQQEYTLNPANPETGDSNTHTLYIYAEDKFGNYGSTTLTLKGQRQMPGQKIGTATIKVDLSALGLGVTSVSYEVLVDEPMSYSVYKVMTGNAVSDSLGELGGVMGEPKESFGYGINYNGTLDIGFYLAGLNPGGTASALTQGAWSDLGSTEEEILTAIDNRFGEGSGLASLWRCIYRNGLNKSSGDATGMYREHDFAQGSGWVYSVNGYFPGQSMSTQYLKDGDVLTLYYTLAYGWDIGSGTPGYGNTVGYCVTARSGSIEVSHNIEQHTGDDGVITYSCKHCGWEQVCEHEIGYKRYDYDNGAYGHIQYCTKCNKVFEGTDEDCTYASDGDEKHKCTKCGDTVAHNMTKTIQADNATCQQAGTKITGCTECTYEKTENTEVKQHTFASTWYYTNEGHYQRCKSCKGKFNEGQHQFYYSDNDCDYVCAICNVLHDWDIECSGTLSVDPEHSTDTLTAKLCSGCGNYLYECSHPETMWEDVENSTNRKAKCTACGQYTKTCKHNSTNSCTSNGDTDHTCKTCGKVVAHTMNSPTTTNGTCQQMVTKTTACKYCDYKLEEEVQGKHSYLWQTSDGNDYTQHGKKCKYCGEWEWKAEYYFLWNDDERDFVCQAEECGKCETYHDWEGDFACEGNRTVDPEKSTCILKAEKCSKCGNYLYTAGSYKTDGYTHVNVVWKFIGGQMKQYCNDCTSYTGVVCEHTGQWTPNGETGHTCAVCGVTGTHNPVTAVTPENATCIETVTKITACDKCGYEAARETTTGSHQTVYKQESGKHGEFCTVCREWQRECETTVFKWDADKNAFICTADGCGISHSDLNCGGALTVNEIATTCQLKVETCSACSGYTFQTEGTFEVYHSYGDDDICDTCNAVKSCGHTNAQWVDVDDGTRKQHCIDCDMDIVTAEGIPVICNHIGADGGSTYQKTNGGHECSVCSKLETHTYGDPIYAQDLSTVSCQTLVTGTKSCTKCDFSTNAPSQYGSKHDLEFVFYGGDNGDKHYATCNDCRNTYGSGQHKFVWNSVKQDYICTDGACGMTKDGYYSHNDWDNGYCMDPGTFTADATLSTCKVQVMQCDNCGLYLYKYEENNDYHNYVDGTCTHCGGTN